MLFRLSANADAPFHAFGTIHHDDSFFLERISYLIGGGPEDNAQALKALLEGKANAYRDIVILNTAAALFGGGHADSLQDGAEKAAISIDQGNALEKLNQLVAITNGKA